LLAYAIYFEAESVNAWMSADADAGDIAALNDCGKEGSGRKPILRQQLRAISFCFGCRLQSLYGFPVGLVDLRCISRANSPLEV
jgi:hypothetical protein